MIRYFTFASLTLFVCMAADCTTTGVDPFAPRVWQQIHSDSENSGLNTVHTTPAFESNRKWSVFVGSTLASPVVHPNGNIYIGNTNVLANKDSELIGVSPGGQIVLQREFATGEVFLFTPAVDRFGDIYLIASKDASGDGRIDTCRLLRVAPNGNILRQAPITCTSSSPKIKNDLIFLSAGGELLVFDRNLEIVDRTATFGNNDICGGFDEPEERRQIFDPSPAITTAPNLTDPDKPLIVVCNYPTLSCFKLINNELEFQWKFELDSDVCDDNRPSFTSPSIVLGGIVMLGYNTDNLVAFDVLTGEHLWSFENPGITGTPSASLADIYAATNYVVRIRGNGEFLEDGITDSPVGSAPAVSLDHVFVANSDGLFTFSLFMDRLSKVPGRMNFSSDPAIGFNGDVYVMTENGFLQAYGGSPVLALQVAPPSVTWLAPLDGQSIPSANGQTLKVAFTDNFTGDVKLVSDQNGILCKFQLDGASEGECVTNEQLLPGTHLLTVAATDPDGNQRAAQITIEVTAPPTILISTQ